MTTVAVLGATSGIAYAALREWAARGDHLRLVARTPGKLERAAADLRVRGASSVETKSSLLGDADNVASAIEWIFADGPVDVVLVCFGVMPPQADADQDLEAASELLRLNGEMNLLAAHLATLRLMDQESGSLAVVGSVAGDRGRKSNYLYGAAKAMVATGVEGSAASGARKRGSHHPGQARPHGDSDDRPFKPFRPSPCFSRIRWKGPRASRRRRPQGRLHTAGCGSGHGGRPASALVDLQPHESVRRGCCVDADWRRQLGPFGPRDLACALLGPGAGDRGPRPDRRRHPTGLAGLADYPISVTSVRSGHRGCVSADPHWSPVDETCDPWGRAYDSP